MACQTDATCVRIGSHGGRFGGYGTVIRLGVGLLCEDRLTHDWPRHDQPVARALASASPLSLPAPIPASSPSRLTFTRPGPESALAPIRPAKRVVVATGAIID